LATDIKPLRRGHFWRRSKLWAKRIFALSATLSTVLLAGWILFLLVQATLRHNSVNLRPLSVPKELVDAGFSSTVVTRRLLDAIQDVQKRAYTLY
jgi:hypothetical protein